MALAVAVRAADLMKRMTRAFLQYPRRPSAKTEALEKIAGAFTPTYRAGMLPPVSGVGLRGEEEIVVLFSAPGYSLNFKGLTKLFGETDAIIEQKYYGSFVPCTQGGDSIGFGAAGGDTGTLGCVVADAGGDEYLLSCNHVIARTNLGGKGTDTVWAPGSKDGGTSADQVGVLDDFEPIHFGGVMPNYYDAAVAKADPAVILSRAIHGVGIVGGVDPAPAYNLVVQKYGKATKLTDGVLALKPLSMVLSYGANTALFVDQYGILEVGGGVFAKDGDSGSIVVSSGGDAVGMVFATSINGDLAIANPIDPILMRFAVSF